MVEDHQLKKHHPVILIPGIVSTGLESWGTESVARGFFRKRLWVRTCLSVVLLDLLIPGDFHHDQGESLLYGHHRTD